MKNVRFYGDKPYKAAVIHGGPGALGTVAAIARELSIDMGVIESLQTKDSISALLVELNEVIKDNSDKPITLIGHSWGAWLAFIYAAQYPEHVKKVILVGSGPFETKYVSNIADNRIKHLSDAEGEEFHELLRKLNTDNEVDKNKLLKRLGELANKSDNYCAFEIDTEKKDSLFLNGEKYNVIWKEAASLRQTGELLNFAYNINCPVVAIHGEFDPHPVEGVKVPLQDKVKDFKFYILNKCGHSPWKEKFAYQEFYRILRNEIGES